jgi:hypothetical protein
LSLSIMDTVDGAWPLATLRNMDICSDIGSCAPATSGRSTAWSLATPVTRIAAQSKLRLISRSFSSTPRKVIGRTAPSWSRNVLVCVRVSENAMRKMPRALLVEEYEYWSAPAPRSSSTVLPAVMPFHCAI